MSKGRKVTYGCTMLKGGKRGLIQPDANGYYPVVVGAFNHLNGSGDYYPLESVRKIFAPGSSLRRRLENGQCRGEWGHPQREAGMSVQSYINRILRIDEGKISHHFRDMSLEETGAVDEYGNPVTLVTAHVRPSGPLGHCVEQGFKNPDENLSFSIRSLSNNKTIRGRLWRMVHNVVTFDAVNEGGIQPANKYSSPSLESFADSSMVDLETDSVIITPEMLERVHEYQQQHHRVGLESGQTVDAVMVRNELGWSLVQDLSPSWTW